MSRKILLAAFLSLAAGGQASAHAQLQQAVPAVGSTAAAVQDVRLIFSEGIEPQFSSVKLSTAAGAVVPAPAATVDPQDSRVLTVHLPAPLPPGAYKVAWAVVSVDTHHTSGDFSFTVRP